MKQKKVFAASFPCVSSVRIYYKGMFLFIFKYSRADVIGAFSSTETWKQKWLKSNADRDDSSQKLVAIKTTRMNLKSKVEQRDSDINYCDVSWHQRDKCKIYSVVFVVVHWRVRTLSFDWRAFFF